MNVKPSPSSRRAWIEIRKYRYGLQENVAGITPAHAGKRHLEMRAPWLLRDHPRTRGEKTKRIPILSHCFQVKGSFSFSFS